jgi:hypothetical protein
MGPKLLSSLTQKVHTLASKIRQARSSHKQNYGCPINLEPHVMGNQIDLICHLPIYPSALWPKTDTTSPRLEMW